MMRKKDIWWDTWAKTKPASNRRALFLFTASFEKSYIGSSKLNDSNKNQINCHQLQLSIEPIQIQMNSALNNISHFVYPSLSKDHIAC